MEATIGRSRTRTSKDEGANIGSRMVGIWMTAVAMQIRVKRLEKNVRKEEMNNNNNNKRTIILTSLCSSVEHFLLTLPMRLGMSFPMAFQVGSLMAAYAVCRA